MRTKNLFNVFGILIFVSCLISAAGVSSPYWDGNPLYMKSGTSEVVVLNLQNMVGEDDLNFKVELESGNAIASLEQDVYFVPFGRKDVGVPINIEIPEKTSLDSVYEIKLTFTEVAEGFEQVQVASSISKSFEVIIVDRVPGEPEKKAFEGRILEYGVVALVTALVMLILIRISKNKKSKK